MKTMKLLTIILVLSLAFVSFSATGEHGSWDCPNCGRKGNTENFCGGCGYSAPWIEEPEDAASAVPETAPAAVPFTEAEISSDCFPDEHFRQFVSGFDLDKDLKISEEELAAVTHMDCQGMGIGSLKGIEYFQALQELNCSNNSLSEIDISSNTALVRLRCYFNKLSSLNTENNIHLQLLDEDNNDLTALDLTNNTELVYLWVWKNRITSLDVSNCVNLRSMVIEDNRIAELDIRNNPVLRVIYCNNNLLTRLDTSMNSNLIELECSGNGISELNLESNGKLERLQCNETEITTLDITHCEYLIRAMEAGIRSDRNGSLLILYRVPDRNKEQDINDTDSIRDTNCYGIQLDKNTRITTSVN